MNQKEVLDLVRKLYECSIAMRDISELGSNQLLDMADAVLWKLEQVALPEELRTEIDDIKKELLDE